MKKPDSGQIVTLLANLGVIAGIIFLAVELNQNNELMEAEARRANYQGGQEFAMSLSQNPELANIIAKVGRDEPLSDAEEVQLYALGLAVLRSFQFGYLESVRGSLSAEDLNPEGLRVLFHENTLDYRLDETWEKAKRHLNPEFIDYFQENVVDKPIQ